MGALVSGSLLAVVLWLSLPTLSHRWPGKAAHERRVALVLVRRWSCLLFPSQQLLLLRSWFFIKDQGFLLIL